MAEILFVFENKKEVIKCDINEKMNDIFKRIAMNIDKDINLLIFIYNGIILNPSESRIFLQKSCYLVLTIFFVLSYMFLYEK